MVPAGPVRSRDRPDAPQPAGQHRRRAVRRQDPRRLSRSTPSNAKPSCGAHALVALTEGHGTRSAVPEIVAVLDLTDPQPDGSPTVDWGLPVELPAEVLRRLFDTADVHPIVVRGGVVLHAPGRLDLGRTTRVANRAQRRALRALYSTCAIPGCDTRYDLCQLHHIIWWEHGGCTDLANLLPLCVRHHHDVHDDGWHLDPGRRPVLDHHLPRRHHTRPPDRRADAATAPHPGRRRTEQPAHNDPPALLRC